MYVPSPLPSKHDSLLDQPQSVATSTSIDADAASGDSPSSTSSSFSSPSPTPTVPADRPSQSSGTGAAGLSMSMSMSMSMAMLRRQPVWLLLAVASGACAAFNGVFAKLTTTSLTTTWAHALSSLLSLSPNNKPIEYLIRGTFFGLNLLFNVAMWALFTAALTRASSTTRVSIVNVSANFLVTALLGLAIFSEKLPPLWWAGAALLAAGNVVIGRREEGEKPGGSVGLDTAATGAGGGEAGEGEGDTDALLADLAEDASSSSPVVTTAELIPLSENMGDAEATKEALRKGEEADAPLL